MSSINIKYEGTNETHEMESLPKQQGCDTSELERKVDELNENLTASDSTKFRFATDGEGNYGYLKADDSFVPFKSGADYDLEYAGTNTTSTTVKISVPDDAHYLIIVLAPYAVTQRIMFVIDTLRKKAGRMVWSNDSLTEVSYAWSMDFNLTQNDISIINNGLDYFIGNAYVYGDMYYKLIKLHD